MSDNLVHNYKVDNIDGEQINLADYSGKVLLIVNTASKCGFTPQYHDLEKLYDEYKDQGLVVLGFPANNFGGQEPGTDEEIKTFCLTKYDVSFPMMSKVSVKGSDIHPLFAELTSTENLSFTGEINWNFEKFLIGKDGKLVERFRSKTKPLSDELISSVNRELQK
jgi:glutathione peroxidase